MAKKDVGAGLLALAHDYGDDDTSEGLFLISLYAALSGEPGPSPAEVVNQLFTERVPVASSRPCKDGTDAPGYGE